jgi:hypothetical protein
VAVKNLPLVEGLIGGDGHLNLVADTEEENATLGLTESDLADDFIEALGEQFFADGADAALTGLTFHQFLVERLAETSDIDSGGLLVADVFDEVLAVLNPLARGEDGIDDLFLLGLRFHGRELSLLLAYIIRKRFRVQCLKFITLR